MQMLGELLGLDLTGPTLWAVYGVLALLALLVIFWLFKKIFGGTTARQTKGRQPRLSVTDFANVDDKRRLILVRRDNVEHLLMIGGPADIVVEQNIGPFSQSPAAQSRLSKIAEPAVQPAPAAKSEPRLDIQPEVKAEKPAPVATPAVAGAAVAGAAVLATANTAQAEETGSTAPAVAELPVVEPEIKPANSLSGISDEIKAEEPGDAGQGAEIPETIGEAVFGDLENALGLDEASVDEASMQSESGASASAAIPDVANDAPKKGNTEDEMQKLLDELAAGN